MGGREGGRGDIGRKGEEKEERKHVREIMKCNQTVAIPKTDHYGDPPSEAYPVSPPNMTST